MHELKLLHLEWRNLDGTLLVLLDRNWSDFLSSRRWAVSEAVENGEMEAVMIDGGMTASTSCMNSSCSSLLAIDVTW